MTDYTRYRSQLIPYIIWCFLCFIKKITNIFDFGKYNEERNVSSRYYSQEHSPNILLYMTVLFSLYTLQNLKILQVSHKLGSLDTKKNN